MTNSVHEFKMIFYIFDFVKKKIIETPLKPIESTVKNNDTNVDNALYEDGTNNNKNNIK